MFAICNPPYIKEKIVVLKDHGGGIGYSKVGNRFLSKSRVIIDLLYAYQILKLAGHKIFLADDQQDPSSSFEEFVAKNKSIMKAKFLFIRFSQPTINNDFEFAHYLKKNKFNGKLIAFGPAIQENTKWFFKDTIFDYFITSEVEAVIEQLSEKLNSKQFVFDDLPGVFRKHGNSYVCANQTSEKADLQALPFFPFNEFKYDSYSMITSRGCPIGCTYCPYILVQNKKFRFKTPEQVVEELEYYQNIGIERIIFRDPNFGFNNNRVLQICNLYVEKKLLIEWECETVLNTLKDEVLNAMGKANCKMIRVGIETVSEEVLKSASRPLKLGDMNNAKHKIDICQKAGMQVYGFFVIGFDGDKLEHIKNAPKIANYLNLDHAQFMTPNLYPGIEQFNKAIEDGIIDEKLLIDRKKFSDVIGSHANLYFSLAKNIDTTTLHIAKMFCERSWSLFSKEKSKKMLLSTKIKCWVYIFISRFLLNNNMFLKPFRNLISENK